ncbi:MAG TPA: ATP-binding protein [Thermoanaerobaculia bacterium]|jgi:PAS domain S-box-containing protein|nr:ATP-binding protein [Thermoanaerobaculia bacterium]
MTSSAANDLIADLLNDHLSQEQNSRLQNFLDSLALRLCKSFNAESLALIAWDKDSQEDPEASLEPLAVSLCNVTNKELPSLEIIRDIYKSSKEMGFVDRISPRDNRLLNGVVIPLRCKGVVIACLLVWFLERPDHPKPYYKTIVQSAPLLAASIQAATRAESWARQRQINTLMQEFFEHSNPRNNQWDLEWLVAQVCHMYVADASIFIEDDGILLPSASTTQQSERQDNNGSHQKVQDHVRWVYEHHRSLRISESIGEPFRQLDRHQNEQGSLTNNFLGGPLRFGKYVVGIVALFRHSNPKPFNSLDESTLQFLGDLLGSALGNWRQVNQANAILASANEGVMVSLRQSATRALDRIVAANPGVAAILGRSPEDIKTLEVAEIYAPGEYERLLPGLREAKQSAVKHGHGEYGPIRSILRRADGSHITAMISFRIQANLIFYPPTYYTIVTARDLSEVEKLAEQYERLLAFLDALDVAYFRTDMTDRTIQSTDADVRITGFSQEDLKHLSRRILYENVADRDKLIDLLRQRNGKLTRHLLELRRKGGERFWAEVDLRLIVDKSGNEVGVEGFYRDVTAQMTLQRFLNDQEDRVLPPAELFARLKEDTEFQIDYISSIGHQIQTPLGSLLGTIENLGRGVLKKSEFQSELVRIIGQLRACSRLVRNLSYMDMVLRREPIRIQQVSIRRLLREAGQDFSTALRAKDLSIEINAGSLQHLELVYGHPELLRQVLANLIDNAIKYSRPHSSIQVKASLLPSGPVLDIINRGIPIHPKDYERIFERGVRSSHAKALVPHGTGLGLWLVRQILTLHNATINYAEIVEESRSLNRFRITFQKQGS